MTWFVIGYLLVGVILMLWGVPAILRRRRIDTVRPERAFGLLVLGEAFGLILVLLILWPVIVPLWLWSETSAAQERARFAAQQATEAERRKREPWAFLSLEEKLEKLRQLSEPRK